MKRREFGIGLFGFFGLTGDSLKETRKTTISWEYLKTPQSDGHVPSLAKSLKQREIQLSMRPTPLYKKISRHHLSSIKLSYDVDAVDDLVHYVQSKYNTGDTTKLALDELTYVVQEVFDYRRDASTTGLPDYPRYANETLYTQYGDCIDKSILMGSMLESLGIDHKYIFPEGHAALLVPEEYSQVEKPDIIPLDGKNYVYFETTSQYSIGKYPTGYKERDIVAYFDPESGILYDFNLDAFKDGLTDGMSEYYTKVVEGEEPESW